MAKTALVVHGHFYQPPRENPWTGNVPREPSAHPFANWNERVFRECYRPNAFSRVVDGSHRVARIVNNYELMSFNFGPTLMSWLEQNHADTYRRILQADRASAQRCGGHGNAIAQAYHHSILPLCNKQDRRTQVRWGLADFRHRFGREPESMWLPETACNDATLGVLIDEGLRYVILSPHQAQRVRSSDSGGEWVDVSEGTIDPGAAYRYLHRDGSGRSIAIFFYDGPVARAIAFEGALSSSDALIDRFSQAAGKGGGIVHVATDGESYGHHSAYGERCLSYALDHVAPLRGFWLTNYGQYLERRPPTREVEIKPGPEGEGTAWSCAHGVGRWIRDCGCHTGARGGWNQAWRGPLRAALDMLRDRATEVFENARGGLFEDPWAARDAYVELVLNRGASREDFLHRQAGRRLRESEQIQALSLLEMQRYAMLMYTSCGWFFADVSGIETQQILRYAARLIDCLEDLEIDPPRAELLEMLAVAKSNIPDQGSGADVYRRHVEKSRITSFGVGAHLAISSLTDECEELGEICGHSFTRKELQRMRQGRLVIATSRILLESLAVGRQIEFAAAAIHLGGIDFYCALRLFPGASRFKHAVDQLSAAFPSASVATLLRIAHEEFGPDEFSLQHVLPEGRDRISQLVFGGLLDRFSDQYAHLYDDNARVIEIVHHVGFELPAELRLAAEYTLGRRLLREVMRQGTPFGTEDYSHAVELAELIARRGYRVDREEVIRIFDDRLTDAVERAAADPAEERVALAAGLLELVERLGIKPELERAQEAVIEAREQRLDLADALEDLAARLGIAPAAESRARRPAVLALDPWNHGESDGPKETVRAADA